MTQALPFPEAAQVVKSSLDVVEVISRYVVLKRTGRNYSGLCPFHNEKTPSFSVNREKGLFKCFGCGEGGDALAFLMRKENRTYGEVIRDLAAEQGIAILQEGKRPEEVAQQKDLTQKIFEMNDKALGWFTRQLQGVDGAVARDYLAGRGTATVSTFQLGYAPPGWENLTAFLRHELGYLHTQPDLLVTAGLASNRLEGQGHYDRFRNRLIIPIHDEQGRVVGFGGRALSDDDKPKYLNSPETPVYNKSRILYGLNQARESIRTSGFAVIMEGYFDVITAHEAGVTQAVGSCGTALTEAHIKLLTRFGAEVLYLAFDSDAAGIKAALAAIEHMEPYLGAIALKVVLVPQGKDPDAFIRQAGGDAFRTLMANAPSFLEFRFDQALQDLALDTAEGRVKAANRLTPLLAAIAHPVLRWEWTRKLAQRIHTSEEALVLEVKRYERGPLGNRGASFPAAAFRAPKAKNTISSRGAISKPQRRSLDRTGMAAEISAGLRKPLNHKLEKAERELLQLWFLNTESYRLMVSQLPTLSLTRPLYQRFLDTLRPVADGALDLPTFLDRLGTAVAEDAALQRLMADLAFEAEPFLQVYGWADLTSEDFGEKVLETVQARQKIIEDYRCWNRQKETNTEIATHKNELSELEFQYRLREQLTLKDKRITIKEQ